MTLVSTDFLDALLTNFQAIFEQGYMEADKQAQYKPFTLIVQSDAAKEVHSWLGAVPAMSQWVDERKIYGLTPQALEVTNLDWESTFGVDRNTLADEKYNMIKYRIQQLASRATTHIGGQIYKALNLGASAKAYDGVTFFNDARVDGDSGTLDNILAGDYSADTTKIKTALRAAIALMKNYKDCRGEPLDLSPDTIICNPAYELYFREALLPSIAGTVSPYGDLIKTIISTPHLTSGSNKDWVLICSANVLKPCLLQMRENPTLTSLDKPDSKDAFMKRQLYYGVNYRGAVSLLEPRTAILVDCS